MPPSAPPASAPGLTDDQIRAEETWLDEWIQAADSMDWSKWEKFWDSDAFLQFCDTPKLEGKDAIARHWQEKFGFLDQFKHARIVRRSFDVTSDLIYQTELLNYKIRGDPRAREIEVHALAVIHKKFGSSVVTGFEAYLDQQPITDILSFVNAMAFATAQISAPGLAQDQLEAEQVWLKQFNQDGDSLDWSRWGKWWAS
ncbi:SnoaL-like domain protein, partial [Rhizoctonia solani 123E]